MPRRKTMTTVAKSPEGKKIKVTGKTAISKEEKTTQHVSSRKNAAATTDNTPPTKKPKTRSTRLNQANVSSPNVAAFSTIQPAADIIEPQQTDIPPSSTQPPKVPKSTTRNKRKSPPVLSSPTHAATITEQQQSVNLHSNKKPNNATSSPAISSPTESPTHTEPPETVNQDTPTKLTKSSILSTKLACIPLNIDPASTVTELAMKTKFLGPRILHWETLDKLNVRGQFNEWITPAWKRFFSITRRVYKPLVFEFYSTYMFDKYTDNVGSKTAMYFSLKGKKFNLSFSDFAVKMGLYSAQDVKGLDFKYGLDSWPSNVSRNDFWTTFGAGQYKTNVTSTSITKPEYRILHRAIAESINQRGKCTNVVTHDDLFFMYCIVHNRPCNLAKCLARYLYKSTGKIDSSAVCGGAYITHLALGLGVVTEDELDHMNHLATTKYFDEAQLKKLEIVEKDQPLRFVDPSNTSRKTAQEETTLAGLASRVSRIEEGLCWTNNAFHFIIQKLGHSYEPPPHMVHADQEAADHGGADA